MDPGIEEPACAEPTEPPPTLPAPRHVKRVARTLLKPTRLRRCVGFEVSLHLVASSMLQAECCLVFPGLRERLAAEKAACKANDVDAANEGGTPPPHPPPLPLPSQRQQQQQLERRELLAIPTCHLASFDIMHRDEQTETERARVFVRFAHFANVLRTLLQRQDAEAFVDFGDLDGMASCGRSTGAVYDEVSSTKKLLGYKVVSYMGVPIIAHPDHGSNRLCLHTMVLHARPADVQALLTHFVREYGVVGDAGVATTSGSALVRVAASMAGHSGRGARQNGGYEEDVTVPAAAVLSGESPALEGVGVYT